MANSYGFDFLKTEHTLTNDGQPKLSTEPPVVVSSQLVGQDGDDGHLTGDALAASVAHKPDLEKQFDVMNFLQAHRSAGCLAPNVIYKATGIDLEETDEAVAKMLQRNPKIRVEHVPDPENPSIMVATYTYQAKYNHVRDRATLLAQINQCMNGVPKRDLLDAYDGVIDDLKGLITAGDVLAINNTEDKDKILFPRGDAFLVELDGIINCTELNILTTTTTTSSQPSSTAGANGGTTNGPNMIASNPAITTTTNNTNGNNHHHFNTNGGNGGVVVSSSASANTTISANTATAAARQIFIVESDVDPTKQIRRGEAVNVGGQWFRVSSAVKEGLPLDEQPVRAQAPLSVVSLVDLNKRNEQDGYIRPFTNKCLPLDACLSLEALDNLQKSKDARHHLHKLAHGRTSTSGGVAAQLLSSNAHASNPTTLASSFATSAGGSNIRKRPGPSNKLSHTNNPTHRRQAVLAAQEAASNPALSSYSHARRHGCTKDVREMYLETRKYIPESDQELQNLLLKHKLLEPGEEMRRKRLAKKANVDNDGKPKKRRYYERKNQRMTNTHLEGTEIGAVLRRATEKQKQGKSVGDGGM